MVRVVVSAFEPFGGESVNPSAMIVEALAKEHFEELSVAGRVLPTAFRSSFGELRRAIEAESPEYVICLGQRGGIPHPVVERIAINCMDAGRPDNEGYRPEDLPVEQGAPAAYFSTLDPKRIVKALRDRGMPAGVSNSAGTFVCNALFFNLLRYSELEQPHLRCCFVHVPLLPEQAAAHGNAASMPLGTQLEAVRIVVGAVCRREADPPSSPSA